MLMSGTSGSDTIDVRLDQIDFDDEYQLLADQQDLGYNGDPYCDKLSSRPS